MSKKDELREKHFGAKRTRDARGEFMSDINDNSPDDMNVNDNVNVNVNVNNNDYLNQLANSSVERPKKRLDSLVNSGIYFEKDIYDILMDLAQKGGRGAKSRIVNDALKVAFKEAGLMK